MSQWSESSGACFRRKWRNGASESLLLQAPALESRITVRLDWVKTSSSTRQNGKILGSRNCDANPFPVNKQALPKRPARRTLSHLRLAESRTSKPKCKPEGQREANSRSEHVTIERPSTRVLNDSRRPNCAPAGVSATGRSQCAADKCTDS